MNEVENHSLAILREIRQENAAFREEILSRFRALEAQQEVQGKKLDKLGVDIYSLRGRIENVGEAVETIARVVSDRAL